MSIASDNSTCLVFDGLFENRPSKFLFVAFSCVAVAILALLFYTVNWFGRFGNDNKQTLVTALHFNVVYKLELMRLFSDCFCKKMAIKHTYFKPFVGMYMYTFLIYHTIPRGYVISQPISPAGRDAETIPPHMWAMLPGNDCQIFFP
jgi:hypothetical protein